MMIMNHYVKVFFCLIEDTASYKTKSGQVAYIAVWCLLLRDPPGVKVSAGGWEALELPGASFLVEIPTRLLYNK